MFKNDAYSMSVKDLTSGYARYDQQSQILNACKNVTDSESLFDQSVSNYHKMTKIASLVRDITLSGDRMYIKNINPEIWKEHIHTTSLNGNELYFKEKRDTKQWGVVGKFSFELYFLDNKLYCELSVHEFQVVMMKLFFYMPDVYVEEQGCFSINGDNTSRTFRL